MTSEGTDMTTHEGAHAGRTSPGRSQRTGAESKVLRQFRLSEVEDDSFVQLQHHRGDVNMIDTQRWLLSLVPGLISGEITPETTTDERAERTAGQWRVVEAAVSAASVAWQEVSPESTGPIEELHADAKWNLTFWEARSRGLDERAARREAVAAHGDPSTAGYISYDPSFVDGQD